MDKVKVLNIDILNVREADLLTQLRRGVLFTPNLDHLVRLQHDRVFYECYQQADWVICDSRVLASLTRWSSHPIAEAIPGSSFLQAFYMHHKADTECKIFLLGAAPGVAEKAKEKINAKVGREMVVGSYSPPFGFEHDEAECQRMIEAVGKSGANVLVVGLGSPKQEKWIIRYRKEMPGVDIIMALGATIDFEAGHIQRAPAAWQKCNMEWLYRFLKEPRRLFRRYFIDDVKFFWHYGKQLMGRYQDPFS